MNRSILWIIVWILFLVGCGGSNDPKVADKSKNPMLNATPDNFSVVWDNLVRLDVLSNDEYDQGTSLEIVKDAKFGKLKVSDIGDIEYKPNKRSVLEDSFSYRLISNGFKSNEVEVFVSLNNSIAFKDGKPDDLLEASEVQAIELVFTTPLENEIDLVVWRNYLSSEKESIAQINVPKGSESVFYNYHVPNRGTSLGDNVEHEIIFETNDDSLNHLSFKYRYLNVAEPEKLFLSIKNIWYNKGASELMLQDRGLVMSWMNYPVWSIPEQPTWSEDPFKNNSWQLYYHSLYWLFAYEYAYDETKDDTYLEIIGKTILDYLQKSPRDQPKSYMSWDDHSVSYRTDVITYFYSKYFKNRWSDNQKLTFIKFYETHADELRKLLDNPLFERNNHGMFHALSLYSLTYAMPKWTYNSDYRVRSLARIYDLFDKMIDKDSGASVEQSNYYQFVAIDLFLKAKDLIYQLSGGADATVDEYLQKMVDFSAHIIYPNGKAPSVGDSNFGYTGYIPLLNKYLTNSGIYSEYWDYVSSKGKSGTNLKNIYLSEKEGYALIRPNHTGDWDEQNLVFVDFGKKKYAHGHHDAMSFSVFSEGHELLIDSGGPYVYLPPGRDYFWSKLGHNSLIIDGEINVLQDAKLVASECLDQVCYALGQLRQNKEIHTRLILTTGKNSLNIYVLDIVNASKTNQYQLNYHFPPSVLYYGYFNETPIPMIKYDDNLVYEIGSMSNLVTDKNYFNGYDSGEYQQGWVTPKYAKKEEAPVLEIKAAGKDFWHLTAFVNRKRMEEVKVTSQNKNYEIKIGERHFNLEFKENSTPNLLIIK